MKKIGMVLVASLGITAFIGIGGEVVMHLWNWNLPAVFGLRQITFWQAIGIFALCRILFGDLGMRARGPHRGSFRRRMAERRWEKMTPDERERFRRSMSARCGNSGAPTGENKEPA